MEGADAIVRFQRIILRTARVLAWVQGARMSVAPDPLGVPPRRPTFSGIVRDSVLAVHRLITQTAEEVTDAAMNRVRRVVVTLLVSIALVIAALAAYLVLLSEVGVVLSELGCHPIWRLYALVVLFAAPCLWLIMMVRTWANAPRRQLKLSSPTALKPDPTPSPR